MTTPSTPEVPPVRLPGQHELPSEDGEPMETNRHAIQYAHLVHALRSATRGRDDVYVGGNMFVYFSPRQLKNEHFRGPDVFVVLGVDPEDAKKDRLSWVLWEEMRLPDVVIELTSPSTRDEDYGKKKDIYARVWKTAVYVIYDPATHHIDAWVLEGGRYVSAPRDENGDIVVRILDLRLGMRDLPLDEITPAPSLRWIDASGEPLPSYDALVDRVAATEARAQGAEARVAALEADLAKTRAG